MEHDMRKQRGFSLIELMVTVAIVGTLAAIAIPSYSSYVRRSKRVDAKVALTGLSQQYERCYTRYNSYTNGNCNVTLGVDTPNKADTSAADPGGTNDAQNFAIMATPKGDQVKDTACGTFKLNSAGVKTVTGATANCW
jgi:type IV pilus assembly protein PilE